MATAISQPRPRSRYDHIFFLAFAAFIAVAVFLGFAQTDYMSGVLKVDAWKAVDRCGSIFVRAMQVVSPPSKGCSHVRITAS
jgi:hypothetical protein